MSCSPSSFRPTLTVCSPHDSIKEGDAISTEFWHLHPQTFSCCLSTRSAFLRFLPSSEVLTCVSPQRSRTVAMSPTAKTVRCATFAVPYADELAFAALFYTPDVTKQAALLYDKEANALARNESPQSASLAHVSRRTKFKGRVRRDAAKMVANEKSLAQARGVEAERRRRMRRETCV